MVLHIFKTCLPNGNSGITDVIWLLPVGDDAGHWIRTGQMRFPWLYNHNLIQMECVILGTLWYFCILLQKIYQYLPYRSKIDRACNCLPAIAAFFAPQAPHLAICHGCNTECSETAWRYRLRDTGSLSTDFFQRARVARGRYSTGNRWMEVGQSQKSTVNVSDFEREYEETIVFWCFLYEIFYEIFTRFAAAFPYTETDDGPPWQWKVDTLPASICPVIPMGKLVFTPTL